MNADQREPVTKDILAQLEERTMKIIEENKQSLLGITKILEEEETLSGETLRTYLKTVA